MDFSVARKNMVENQVRTNKVDSRHIIAAMSDIPREAFVPASFANRAYTDEAPDLGGGRYLLEPMVLARLLRAAKIDRNDVVLDIGCGAGYDAAILSRLANTVVALDGSPELAKAAAATLANLGIDTVAVVEGDMAAGYPKQAPYDVIFLGGAVFEIPEDILQQLGDGGRLVAVVRGPGAGGHEKEGYGKGVLVTRSGDSLSRQELFDGGTPFLPGFEPRPSFTF